MKTLEQEFETTLQKIEQHCTNHYTMNACALSGQMVLLNSTTAFQLFRNMKGYEKLMFLEVLKTIVLVTLPRDMESTVVNAAASYVEHFCHIVAQNSLN